MRMTVLRDGGSMTRLHGSLGNARPIAPSARSAMMYAIFVEVWPGQRRLLGVLDSVRFMKSRKNLISYLKSRVCSSSRTQLLLFNSQKAELSRSAVQPPMQSEQPSSAEQPAMQCSQCDTILCQSEQCSFYNKDGTYCRLHPGKNTTRDAMPRIGVVQPDSISGFKADTNERVLYS